MRPIWIIGAVVATLALTIGPVFWGQFCVVVAVWLFDNGWVAREWAPDLGRGLLAFPFFLAGAIALTWVITLARDDLRRVSND